MAFNSMQYVYFFIIVSLLFYILPKRTRIYLLLVASYYFYMCWNATYAILIVISTISTYLLALVMKKTRLTKLVTACGVVINLLILFFFKYWNFCIDSLNSVFNLFSFNTKIDNWNILLPVGLSFYTFQSLGYLIDVYRGKIEAEKNLFRYALFISFFPQLVAGPIERTENIIPQLKNIESIKFKYENIKNGLITILYGLFIKIVIADRLSVLVDLVYSDCSVYRPSVLIFTAVAFSLQIYCDFSGYSTIAIGSAKVLGITLCENFRSPYFSSSIKEFWRRWHISLSGWFRDYVYIPLGGNRKGVFRKNINLLVTFLLSGLWHGAGWNFVFWGGLHGIYQIAEPVTVGKIRFKNSWLSKFVSIIITYTLTTFAWIFFRAGSIKEAFSFISCMFIPQGAYVGLQHILGMKYYYAILMVIVILIIELILDKKKLLFSQWMSDIPVIVSWPVLLLFIFSILVFGVYGLNVAVTPFLYFQF